MEFCSEMQHCRVHPYSGGALASHWVLAVVVRHLSSRRSLRNREPALGLQLRRFVAMLLPAGIASYNVHVHSSPRCAGHALQNSEPALRAPVCTSFTCTVWAGCMVSCNVSTATSSGALYFSPLRRWHVKSGGASVSEHQLARA